MSNVFINHPYGAFCYRAAAICIRNGQILLQKPSNAVGYTLPGGLVQMGETGAVALARHLGAELGASVTVGDLKWVGESFFPWDLTPCHQLEFYYAVTLPEEVCTEPITTSLVRKHGQAFDVNFHWVPLADLPSLSVCPTNIPELLGKWDNGVQHFICNK